MLTEKLNKGSLQRTDNGGPANTWEPRRPGHVAGLSFTCLLLSRDLDQWFYFSDLISISVRIRTVMATSLGGTKDKIR